jgi:hypothetical protein
MNITEEQRKNLLALVCQKERDILLDVVFCKCQGFPQGCSGTLECPLANKVHILKEIRELKIILSK